MTEYRRRPDKEPEVRAFAPMANHRAQMIEGHLFAAWVLGRGDAYDEKRAMTVSVRPADNRMAVEGVHVYARDKDRHNLFLIHAGEFLVWENSEFRVYTAEEFAKVFEAVPQAASDRLAPGRTRSNLAIQRDGAE